MPWQLTVRDPTGQTLKATVTDQTTPNPVMAVEAVVDGVGSTSSLNLRARNDLLGAAPRDVATYEAWTNWRLTLAGASVTLNGMHVTVRDNYGPLAAGVIVTCPPTTVPGAGPADNDADALERITAEGLERLLRERIVKPRAWTDEDVATIAYQLCSAFTHPALTVDPANFPATGFILGLFYTPEMTVADALDDLAETLPTGGRWWVNANREVVFKAGGS